MKSKTVLITGASAGFGRIAAEMLLHRGHRVIAALRGGQARLEKEFLAAHLQTGRLHAVDLHLEQPGTFRAAVSEVAQKFQGRLDVLINNAGYGQMGPVEILDEALLRKQMEVNFFGTALLTQALLPAVREAGGRIINVSSIVGRVGLPFYGAYAASKFALEGYSESLWYDLRPLGVQVGLVEPGGYRTEFSPKVSREGLPSADPTGVYAHRLDLFRKSVAKKNFSPGRDPTDVARVMVRLSERRRLPFRTVLGGDAKLAVFIRRLLPEWLRLRLMDWTMRRKFFAE
ncbi:MAG TPA: SDR family oxidoreductase [Bdellovibrionota bacterium]|nr:SDR family oxidoreductase [Bdellovibrionota bacterium]